MSNRSTTSSAPQIGIGTSHCQSTLISNHPITSANKLNRNNKRHSPKSKYQNVSDDSITKGKSLNHLIHFNLPPRLHKHAGAVENRTSKSKSTCSTTKTLVNWFSRDKFINANFRFVVNPDGEYTQQVLNPDVPVPWDMIDQVIFPTSDIPACPICLSLPPIAPRITKCGHVYCLPCLLQYHTIEPYEVSITKRPDQSNAAQFMQRWRKCPICYDIMYEKDMRPIRLWTVPPLPTKAETGMVLPETVQLGMHRLQELMHEETVVPTTNQTKSKRNKHQYEHGKLVLEDMDYEYDLMAHDSEYANVAALVPVAQFELTLITKNPTNSSLLQAAQGQIKHANTKLGNFVGSQLPKVELHEGLGFSRLMGSTPTYLKNEVWTRDLHEIKSEMVAISQSYLNKSHVSPASVESIQQSIMFFEQALESLTKLIDPPESSVSVNPTTRKLSAPPKHAKSNWRSQNTTTDPCLYIATDRSHTYLHPFDTNILNLAYHSLPTRINIPVLKFHDTTITIQVRKQFPILAHLPLGCDVILIEMDVLGFLHSNGMGDSPVVQTYMSEINTRHRSRIQAARVRAVHARTELNMSPKQRPGSVIHPSDWDPYNHHHPIEDRSFLFSTTPLPYPSSSSSSFLKNPTLPSFAQAALKATAPKSQFTFHHSGKTTTSSSSSSNLSRSAFAIDLFQAIRTAQSSADEEDGQLAFHSDFSDDPSYSYEYEDVRLSKASAGPRAKPPSASTTTTVGSNRPLRNGAKRKGKQKPTVIALNASHRRYE